MFAVVRIDGLVGSDIGGSVASWQMNAGLKDVSGKRSGMGL
jgi:hypothetical protein